MLKDFGFSQYESKVYEVLVASDEPMDVSLIAKHSSVPKTKIYEVLSRMVEKGMIMEAISEKKKMYTALPLELAVERLTSQFQANIEKFKENKFIPINENLDSDIYFAICEFLKQKGFIHYEVSNFALNDNYKSVHNLTYWNNDKYLGIGAAASYYIDNIRYTNINNLNKYFEGIDNESLCYLEEDEIVPGEKMFEEVMLGFRKLEGINLQKFEEKFEKTIFDAYPVVNKLIDNGNLEVSNGYIKVPESKIYILNNILINFLDEDLDKAYENKITESAEYDISESIISAEENANE